MTRLAGIPDFGEPTYAGRMIDEGVPRGIHRRKRQLIQQAIVAVSLSGPAKRSRWRSRHAKAMLQRTIRAGASLTSGWMTPMWISARTIRVLPSSWGFQAGQQRRLQ